MSSKNQHGWEIVDRAEAEKATKRRTAKQAAAEAAVEALTALKAGQAIRIPVPKDRSKADNLRCWWRTKMNLVSRREQMARAFVSITSSDSRFLFIQRNPNSEALKPLDI